jgi:hypothetical protein
MPIRDDERENIGHSVTRRREPVAIEPEAASAASLVPGATGATETARKADFRGFALTWLGPLGLVLLAAASSVYLRGTPSAAVPACAAADWRTELTLDRSRPELATTTLRSRNAVGPEGQAACAEVSFACGPDGPYFELRSNSPALPMRQIGPIEVRNLSDDLAAQVFAPPAGAQTAVRVAEKAAVELIAYAIANSLAFRIPITFGDGEAAVAEFKSYHFSAAVRPVLFACNMRSLQIGPPSADEE